MRTDEVLSVIVQAGGRGTRLGHLTANKPKCLLSVHGEPLLYRLFHQLPHARFIIIADYRADVLAAYLNTVPPKVEHTVVATQGTGTLSGMADAMALVPGGTPFLIVWCDLFFDDIPTADLADHLLVGVSDQIECRWSVTEDGALEEVRSTTRGVAGFFAVPSKEHLGDLPAQGEFVRHLRQASTPFDTVDVGRLREFGSLAAVQAHEEERGGQVTRFFNRVDITARAVVKTARVPEYGHLLEDEARWYETVAGHGYRHAPRLLRRSPLTIERIEGAHPFDLDLGADDQAELLTRIMDGLDELHALESAPPDAAAQRAMYRDKTLSRLSSVRRLIPGVDRRSFVVNGRTCRNPLHLHFADWFDSTIEQLPTVDHALIHGDPTFSNTLVDGAGDAWFIDPRGAFGGAGRHGDPRYDWAKVLYSVEGNYDQFNRRNFRLRIDADVVGIEIASNGWEDHAGLVRDRLAGSVADLEVIHALIWLSLTGYALDDVDSVLGAFFQGIYLLEGAGA